jgi:chorismate mutase
MLPREELARLRQLVRAIDDGIVLLSERGITPEKVALLRADVGSLDKRISRIARMDHW